MTYIAKLLAGGCIILTGCKNSLEFPPSKFIGLYQSYNGYNNGELPATQTNYSGIWTSKDGLLVGHYKDGIPSGEWIKYYSNKKRESSITYCKNGSFYRKDWYPDGTLLSQISGTYNFSNKGLLLIPQLRQDWDWHGRKIEPDIPEKNSVFRYTQRLPSNPHGMENSTSNKYEVKCFCIIVDNHFEIALYLWNRHETLLPMQKIFISGECEPNHTITIKAPLEQNEHHLRFSNYSIKDKILNLNFYAPGKVDASTKITIKLYLN